MKRITLISIVLSLVLMFFSCGGKRSGGSLKPVVTPEALDPSVTDITLEAKGVGVIPKDVENSAQARLKGIRAAKMDAYRNLTEKVYGVRITGQTKVVDHVSKDDTIRGNVQGFIKNAQVKEEKIKPDGTCEVTLELYLGKKFAKIIMKGKR